MWNVLWLEKRYSKVLLCRPFGNELRGPLARESITGVDIGLNLFTYWVLHPCSSGSPGPQSPGLFPLQTTSLVQAFPLQVAEGRVIWGKARDLHVSATFMLT